MLGDLISLIGAPCLIFSSLVSLEVTPAAMIQMALATGCAFVAFGLLGFVFLRVMRLSPQTYLAPLSFGNQGNMGVPLCLFAFGVEGRVLILQCAMPAAVFNYLLAQRYDRSPEEVASIVVVSTLLAAVSLPLLLPFLI